MDIRPILYLSMLSDYVRTCVFIWWCHKLNISDDEEEEEAKDFKGAVVKFHKLFKLPQEEKLVNCKSTNNQIHHHLGNFLSHNNLTD